MNSDCTSDNEKTREKVTKHRKLKVGTCTKCRCEETCTHKEV